MPVNDISNQEFREAMEQGKHIMHPPVPPNREHLETTVLQILAQIRTSKTRRISSDPQH